jgi:WD40 repeat protein
LKRKANPGLCYAFSGDGRHALVAGGGKKIAVFELESGRELAPFEASQGASVINFSPSGGLIATAVLQQKDALTVWEFEGRRSRFTIHPGTNGSSSVVFSPDESLVAYGGFDGSITLWRSDSGKLHRSPRKADGVSQGISFHSGGNHLLAVGSGRLSVLDITSGERKSVEPLHSWDAHLVAASPDGRHAATAGLDDNVFLWSINGR